MSPTAALALAPVAKNSLPGLRPRNQTSRRGVKLAKSNRASGMRARVRPEGVGDSCYRWYVPQTGRYTRTDPLGRWGDPHLYAYAQSNPMRFSDPKGLDSVGCDLPAFAGVLSNDSPCALACCAAHDKCYDNFKCTAGSWLNPAGQYSPAGCTLCNGGVEARFAKCLAFEELPSGPQYYCASQNRFVSIPGDFSSLDDARPACEEDHSKRCCEAEPESLGNLFGAVF